MSVSASRPWVPRPPSISWQPWSGAKARSESYPLQCRRAMEASCAAALERIRLAPMPPRDGGQLRKGIRVGAQRAQGLRTLRRVAVHGGVVIPVVDEEQVVLVLPEELLRARVDLVHGVQDVVVHRPVQEDLGERAARGGDDGRAHPCAQGGVKERVHPQDGLGIAADAVPLGRQAGVHGGKADRRHRRVDGLHRQGQGRGLEHGQEGVRVPRKEIVRDAVGVVEQRALDGTTAERGARIPLQRKVGFAGAVRRGKAHQAREGCGDGSDAVGCVDGHAETSFPVCQIG